MLLLPTGMDRCVHNNRHSQHHLHATALLMPHLRMSLAAPPYLQDRPTDRCHMLSRTQDTCAGLDTCETQHVSVCGYLCKQALSPASSLPAAPMHVARCSRVDDLLLLGKAFDCTDASQDLLCGRRRSRCSRKLVCDILLVQPCRQQQARHIQAPDQLTAVRQLPRANKRVAALPVCGKRTVPQVCPQLLQKGHPPWHSRAKALNCSSMNGSVAHVSSASLQDVRNIITAPRMTVTRDLQ